MKDFVGPLYLSFLHGNAAKQIVADKSAFLVAAREAGDTISDAQLSDLLQYREWRGRLTAAWLAGLGNRLNHEEKMAALLLTSELCYAGQGYCFALASFGTDRSIVVLESYLERYLPLRERYLHQTWALGALAYCAPERAIRFLKPSLWTGKGPGLDPEKAIQEFAAVMQWIRNQDLLVHARSRV